MVQREVGERLAAAPGSARLRHPVGPRPARLRRAGRCAASRGASSTRSRTSTRCSSACAAGRPAPPPELRALVAGAFAHRRKASARSLALSTGADVARVRAALVALGHPPDVRAERLRPDEFAALAERSSGRGVAELAPAKINLCLYLGPRRADGRHELVTRDAVARPRRPADPARPRPAPATRSAARGSTGRTSARRRSPPSARATGWDGPPPAARDREARPRGRRDGRRLGGRRRRPAADLRPRRASPTKRSSSSWPPSSAPTSPASCAPAGCSPPAPASASCRLADPAPFGVLVLPSAAELEHGRRLRRGRPAGPRADGRARWPASTRSGPGARQRPRARRPRARAVDRPARSTSPAGSGPIGDGQRVGADGDRALRKPRRGPREAARAAAPRPALAVGRVPFAGARASQSRRGS